MPKTKPCNSCGAPVIWCMTANRKRMPVDAEPTDDGNLVIRQRGDDLIALHTHKDTLRRPGEAKFTSHFATCPNADRHRKKGKTDATV